MNQIFERARGFIYRNARPIDLARWKLHFEGGDPGEILTCLAAYQNPDGGFGHGLECDALNPESSPMQTWSATTYLRLIDMYDPANPIVAGLLNYLTRGRDFDGHRWAYSVASNNDHPHAPWWHFDAAAPRFDYNPTAALAGYMLRASEQGSEANELARRIAREAFDWAMSRELPPEMHLLPGLRTLCWDVLAVCPELFDAGALLARIEKRMVELVEEDGTSGTASTAPRRPPSSWARRIRCWFPWARWRCARPTGCFPSRKMTARGPSPGAGARNPPPST